MDSFLIPVPTSISTEPEESKSLSLLSQNESLKKNEIIERERQKQRDKQRETRDIIAFDADEEKSVQEKEQENEQKEDLGNDPLGTPFRPGGSLPPDSQSTDRLSKFLRRTRDLTDLPQQRKSRQGAAVRVAASKVDFVKVRVWQGEHYHVLSRYMISRFLTVTKIPSRRAIKISLDLKKELVDQGTFDVTLAELESRMFDIMHREGYDDSFVNRYKMMSRFHQERIPLIILISGTACIGKALLANLLAARLNLPTVLQTQVVYSLHCSFVKGSDPTPIYLNRFNSDEEFLKEYRKRCKIVRQGLTRDIEKTFADGKAIIIEGMYLDPWMYRDVLAGHFDPSAAKQTVWLGGRARRKEAKAAAARAEQKLADENSASVEEKKSGAATIDGTVLAGDESDLRDVLMHTRPAGENEPTNIERAITCDLSTLNSTTTMTDTTPPIDSSATLGTTTSTTTTTGPSVPAVTTFTSSTAPTALTATTPSPAIATTTATPTTTATAATIAASATTTTTSVTTSPTTTSSPTTTAMCFASNTSATSPTAAANSAAPVTIPLTGIAPPTATIVTTGVVCATAVEPSSSVCSSSSSSPSCRPSCSSNLLDLAEASSVTSSRCLSSAPAVSCSPPPSFDSSPVPASLPSLCPPEMCLSDNTEPPEPPPNFLPKGPSVVIPFLLSLSQRDHSLLSHNRFIRYFGKSEFPPPEVVFHNLRLIDGYLKKSAARAKNFYHLELDTSLPATSVKKLHSLCLEAISPVVAALPPQATARLMAFSLDSHHVPTPEDFQQPDVQLAQNEDKTATCTEKLREREDVGKEERATSRDEGGTDTETDIFPPTPSSLSSSSFRFSSSTCASSSSSPAVPEPNSTSAKLPATPATTFLSPSKLPARTATATPAATPAVALATAPASIRPTPLPLLEQVSSDLENFMSPTITSCSSFLPPTETPESSPVPSPHTEAQIRRQRKRNGSNKVGEARPT